MTAVNDNPSMTTLPPIGARVLFPSMGESIWGTELAVLVTGFVCGEPMTIDRCKVAYIPVAIMKHDGQPALVWTPADQIMDVDPEPEANQYDPQIGEL